MKSKYLQLYVCYNIPLMDGGKKYDACYTTILFFSILRRVLILHIETGFILYVFMNFTFIFASSLHPKSWYAVPLFQNKEKYFIVVIFIGSL